MPDALNDLAVLLAGALGPAWRHVPAGEHPWDGSAIAHTGGYLLTVQHLQGRLYLTGRPPRAGIPLWQAHQITTRADRPVLAIAGAVEARLLPAYLAAWDDADRWCRDDDEKSARGRDVVARLAALIPDDGKPRRPIKPADRDLDWHFGVDPTELGRGKVHVSYAGEDVSLKLDYLTPAAAERVLRALFAGGAPDGPVPRSTDV